jgi:hypothetical protein
VVRNSSTGDSSRRGGGKLNRTETVTIRLDPRLNYLCELAARAQRRTKSSFIESAVAEHIYSQPTFPRHPEGPTLGDMAEQLWRVRDHERLISLFEHAPHLMSFEEQQIWALIAEHQIFWRGKYRTLSDGTEVFEWKPEAAKLRRDQVASLWNTLTKVADGSLPPSALTSPGEVPSRHEPNLDDDIPS